MNCPKCNFEVDADSTFCENCGASLKDTGEPVAIDPQPALAFEETVPVIAPASPSLFARKPQIIGIIASAIVILFGILTSFGVFNSNINAYGSTSAGTTTTTSHKAYGGDAYTGIQNAGADASNNAAVAAENIKLTNELLKDSIEGYNLLQQSVSSSVGMLIICFGLIGGGYFTCGLLKKEN